MGRLASRVNSPFWRQTVHLFSSTPCSLTHPKTKEAEEDLLYRLLDVEVRGNDPAVLKSYESFATMAARELNINIAKCWAPKKPHHDRLTLLRSIHVNKKCRVQYEMRTYFRMMQFQQLTSSTADTFLEYIQRNLPEGVAMKVTKTALHKLPEHFQPPKALEGEL